MSFILDALKKSEAERQRQTMPGLVDPGIVPPRARLPRWALGLGVLLAVNLVGLAFILTRSPTPAPGAAAPQVAAIERPAAAVPPEPAPRYATPQYAAELPVAQPPVAPQPVAQPPVAPQPATQFSAAELPGVEGRVPRRRDPTQSDDDFKSADAEVLPTVSELNLTGAQALPELHLDVHVFSTHAADRFVYINMRKYHEGATLQEGPSVERIRRDGVVLTYQGLRFLLPRQ